ncbi:MAG TPA: gamma-glutamyl-gamma-aminobutyrate hydrolase family protein [Pyrinomonadaceae bacterium]|jgi:GMP synthase-like glutamine amidotransferase|nr:gamma-glutamyl-gamma-aminobutyrate hydrolase family protein [Pyrinomonadaceae bacterium]
MIEEPMELITSEPHSTEADVLLPFPIKHTFCRYEPIEKRIDRARVLVVDCLLRDEDDLSDLARHDWGSATAAQIKRERYIAGLAMENILGNVEGLVKKPVTEVAHLGTIATAAKKFNPDAIVLSGTLRDFDYYNPSVLDTFGEFIRATRIPVLAICGGHQLVGLSFGAQVVTLDRLEQHEQRENRPIEYQYRFIRITEPGDPIFHGMKNPETGAWDETTEARVLRVWQNHGLQLDRVPEGFKLLATSYLCRIQMMVKRDDDQLIYTVQFHLEKSFEDWNKSRTRWEHQNESRDGRILFENFLFQALARGK